jgi:hypothetical protein
MSGLWLAALGCAVAGLAAARRRSR